jgi:hypothetical protein
MKSGVFEITVASSNINVTRTDDPRITPSATRRNVQEEALAKIAALRGLCAHLNQGWWSYEWCFEGKIKQFHLEIQASGGMEQILTATDVTSLGEFLGRNFDVLVTPNDSHNENTAFEHETKSERNVVQITEDFVGGDICLDTGRPRQTRVLLRCCPGSTAGKKRGTAMRNGIPLPVDIVYIQDVTESSENVCFYRMTVCTTLLCDRNSNDSIDHKRTPQEKNDLENSTISNILEITFERPGKKCIQYSAGW